jgi:hypothetical protein
MCENIEHFSKTIEKTLADNSVLIDRAYKHCKGNAVTRSFASAGGQKL